MSTIDKLTRLGLITLICLLHGALFLGWHDSVPLSGQPSISYMKIWDVERSAPKRKVDAPRHSKAAGAFPRSAAESSPLSVPKEVAHDKPDIPAPVPEAPLDLNRLRSLALDNDRNRIKSPLERLREDAQAARTVETQVADAAKRGARKSCQSDFAGYGLFAFIPLVYGTATDDGCKWK